MSCSDPSCSLFVKTDSPYRAPAVMPEEPKEEIKMEPKKPSKILKALGFAGKMVLGSVLLVAITVGLYSAYWILFPGLFRLGILVSNYFGWNAGHWGHTDYSHQMDFWLVGVGTLIAPILGGGTIYYLGNRAYEFAHQRIQK